MKYKDGRFILVKGTGKEEGMEFVVDTETGDRCEIKWPKPSDPPYSKLTIGY